MPGNDNNGARVTETNQSTGGNWVCPYCEDTFGASDSPCEKCKACDFCCEAWQCSGCKIKACGEKAAKCDSCYNCPGCCKCWTCTKCTRKRLTAKPACELCNYCTEGCCRCKSCPNCRRKYAQENGNFCRDCHICNTCCQCHGIDRYNPETITFHDVEKTYKFPKLGFRTNPSKRYIAAEIEIGVANQDKTTEILDTIKKWGGSIVDDGSLPKPTGFEINTAPANGELYVKQINEICEALEKQQCKITPECGLHVHVDARDFSYTDLKKLLILYEQIEPGIFSIIAPDRVNSTFCRPCGGAFAKGLQTVKPDDLKTRIIGNVYGLGENPIITSNSMEEIRRHKYNNSRYSAMNVHSWFMTGRGTIESRVHQGTKSPKHIINWGILWAGILDYAVKTPESDIINMKGSSVEKLVEVAPTNDVKEWVVARREYFANYSKQKGIRQLTAEAISEMARKLNPAVRENNPRPARMVNPITGQPTMVPHLEIIDHDN